MSALLDLRVLFGREVMRYRRERAYWVGQLVFPLVFVGFMGFGLDRITALPNGATYTAHLASGMLALMVGSGAVGSGFTLIEDRDTGFLRALLIAPVSRASIVLAKLLARALASLVLIGLLLLVLMTFTPLRVANPVALIAAILGITAMFSSMGVVLASRLRRGESFRTLSAMVTVPLYLFSGIFYPVDTLPLPTRWIAFVNPLTYGVELLRYGVMDVSERSVLVSAALLFALGSIGVVAAIISFDRSSRG